MRNQRVRRQSLSHFQLVDRLRDAAFAFVDQDLGIEGVGDRIIPVKRQGAFDRGFGLQCVALEIQRPCPHGMCHGVAWIQQQGIFGARLRTGVVAGENLHLSQVDIDGRVIGLHLDRLLVDLDRLI